MIIKSSKRALCTMLLGWLLISLFSVLFFLEISFSIVSTIFATVMHLFEIRIMCILFRTIEIDENGCTVSLLFFKKRYLWNELKTKHLEDYGSRFFPASAFARNIKRGVIFSTKENFRTPKMVHITGYWAYCLNPFCFFVVLFKPEEGVYTEGFYEVDEDVFMSKMEEYGVTITK